MIKNLAAGHYNIHHEFVHAPNSAGGVDVKGVFHNTTGKAIKYVSIYFVPLNRVGDVQQCTIRHESEHGIEITGPIKPGSSHKFHAENMWYNHSITSVQVTEIEIEYMDGTSETIPASQINVTQSRDWTSIGYIAAAILGVVTVVGIIVMAAVM